MFFSAGVGRTGTYIAMDILLDEMEETGEVDIFNCTKKMRSRRPNMIQTMVTIFLYLWSQ